MGIYESTDRPFSQQIKKQEFDQSCGYCRLCKISTNPGEFAHIYPNTTNENYIRTGTEYDFWYDNNFGKLFIFM